MKDEIAAAVVFLTRIVKRNTKLSVEQLNKFSEQLALTLVERFRNHWYTDKPSKGQAYRCIRVSRNEPRDSVLAKTARDCGIHYNRLNLPAELTLWVDPMDVSCRFGERGTVCEVAKFSQQTQTTDNNTTRPLTPTDNLNGNVPTNMVLNSDVNDNARVVNVSIPSPPLSPRLINDNARLTSMTSSRRTVVSHNTPVMNSQNTAQFVFNKNATNMPRTVHLQPRPQNKVWVRQARVEQYRWVNKSIAARA